MAQHSETATLAGGCFWCLEAVYQEMEGVLQVESGYTGGYNANPTYEEVSSGSTGHAESVQVVYDPAKVSYQKLVDVFWHNIDPLAVNAQFCDHGTQYRSAIFYQGEEQKRIAEPGAQLELDGQELTQQLLPDRPDLAAQSASSRRRRLDRREPQCWRG